MGYSILIDGAVALLLGVTLVFMARLNRRIGELKRQRASFDSAIERFAAAAGEAQKTLAEMRQISAGEGKALQDAVKKGAGLADDLDFLVGRAGSAADRLEAAIGQSRQATLRPVPAPPRDLPADPAAEPARKGNAAAGPLDSRSPRVAATQPARRPVAVESLPEGERALLRALAGLR